MKKYCLFSNFPNTWSGLVLMSIYVPAPLSNKGMTVFPQIICTKLGQFQGYPQCAEEKSNESVEDMDGAFAGW